MFLIKNDEADVLKRSEDRTSGTDDDRGISPGDTSIFVISFSWGELTMKDGDLWSESAAEIFHHRWGKVDLWHEHEDGFAFIKDLLA